LATFLSLFFIGAVYLICSKEFHIVKESIDWIWQTSTAELVFYFTDCVLNKLANFHILKTLQFRLYCILRKSLVVWSNVRISESMGISQEIADTARDNGRNCSRAHERCVKVLRRRIRKETKEEFYKFS
jgi:hypothetical protein